ncbi:hypothetical protein [Stenotrophomonas sp. PS02289]|uniref:hypothetical protein n=1 Tax=Stenotrophomonas sp. PS02289 TaxID=2991422 RepID=UPI00249B417C|nr:hypothetical protein [Stenotrophomonas sp. PS02289]
MNRYASVGVKPIGSLRETAELLGEVLSGLNFQEDTDWVYDEYPNFYAYDDTCVYALLGCPAPEDDLREDPDGDFELLVSPIDDSSDEDTDVSAELVSIINSDGRLSAYMMD